MGFATLSALARTTGPVASEPLGLPIGLELFTVRHECEQDFPGTLEKVAAIGYKEVELFDFYGRKASEIRRILSSSGLVAPSSHTPSYALSPRYTISENSTRWYELIQYAAELGVHYLGGSVGGVSELNPMDDYQGLAELMNATGEQCKRAGIQFACRLVHKYHYI